MKNPLLILLIISFSIVLIIFFWRHPYFISAMLIIVQVIKYKIHPIKKELHFYFAAAICGSVGESMMIYSGLWKFANTQILNIPIWLPFFWGTLCTCVISLYLTTVKSPSG